MDINNWWHYVNDSDTAVGGVCGIILSGSDGADDINNYLGDYCTIIGYAGDDTIIDQSNYVLINGGTGNDAISHHAKYNLSGSYTTIYGDDGDDYIQNWNWNTVTMTDNVIIYGGDGSDKITNTAASVTIDGGTGNDTVINDNSNYVSINGGDGNDSVTVQGSHNKIYTATDNWQDDNDDFVSLSSGSENTVETGWGNDTIDIKAGAIKNSINSGQGNDSIVNAAEHITIYGGTSGDNTIENYGEHTFIDSGDEYATSDKDSIKNSAANVTIKGCGGNDVIENWGRGVSIDAGAGDDVIKLSSSTPIDDVWKHLVNPLKTFVGDIAEAFLGFNPAKLKSDLDTAADETKPFEERLAIIDGLAKNYTDDIGNEKLDKIFMNNEAYRLLNSCKGKVGRLVKQYEVIKSTGTLVYTYATDKLLLSFAKEAVSGFVACFEKDSNGRWCFAPKTEESERTTVRGSKGDDEFRNDELTFHVYEYAEGDGNDVFYGWNLNDTLRILDASYTTTRNGNDFVIHVGDGSITFKNYYSSGKPLRPNSRWEVTPVEIEGISTSSGNNSGNTVPPYITPPEGISVDKDTVKADEGFSGPVDVSEGYSPDVTKIDAVNASSVVIFGNESVREITSGSGDDKIHHGGSFSIIVSGAGKDSIFSEGDENTLDAGAGNDEIFSVGKKNLVNYHYGDGNDTVTGFDETSTLKLGDGTQTYSTAKSGNDTLDNFAADDLISVTGTVTDGTVTKGTSVLTVGKNKITVKDSSTVTFADDGGTKIFSNGIFTDTDGISATLTSATKDFDAASTTFIAVTGNDKANKITSNATGMTLTGGKGNDTFVTAGGDDFISDYGDGSDKISLGSALKDFSVTGNDVSLELADGSVTIANGAGKKISLVSGGKTTANIFTDGGIMNTAGTSVTLNASTTEFTATSKIVTIDAGLTSNATITGNSKANKISFGDGENVFVWTGGNDTLTNFGANDLISVTGAVTDGTVTKGNSVLTVGKNKITVKDSSTVTFADDGGTKIFDGGIFFDEDETSATLGSAVKDFDAASTTFTAVTGNVKANKITSNATGMTLTGGKGNDSLWGGDNSDTFTYSKGDGKDVIFGFGSNDLLEIVGLNGAVTGKFNSAGTELTVKVGNTAVAVLKDFGATTTFNINGDTYHVSGQTIVK